MKCYIFDIDGTLADCKHRLHHIQKARRIGTHSSTPAKTMTSLLTSCLWLTRWLPPDTRLYASLDGVTAFDWIPIGGFA